MTVTATLDETRKATERLKGLMVGVACDRKLGGMELKGLHAWLSTHRHLCRMEPFQGTARMLDACLSDGIVTESEQEEILKWCDRFAREPIPQCATAAARRLHGVVHGILLDGTIQEEEIRGLFQWIRQYEVFREYWPFSAFWDFLEEIGEDGKMTDSRRATFAGFCQEFSELVSPEAVAPGRGNETWMNNLSPVLLPFTALCDRECRIQFTGRSFCFSGPARYGARKRLHEIVSRLGGFPEKTVSHRSSYVVIGAQSPPCWAYSTYERRIEKAIELQDEGWKITIVHEDDFIAQALEG